MNAFNRFFEDNGLNGVAYRRKQHRFSSQMIDVMVDSAEPGIRDIAVEHKSFKTSSSNKLYFSQHFSSDTDGSILDADHQVERVEEFRKRSGYQVFLGVEVRRGRGRRRRLFFVDWDTVLNRFRKWRDGDGPSGFSVEWMEEHGLEAGQEGGRWQIPEKILLKD